MGSRIRVSVGDVEIECEGSEEFIKAELPVLLQKVAELFSAEAVPDLGDRREGEAKRKKTEKTGMKGTTNTIASKLNVKSGPELIMAAAAHLTFVSGKETFKRQELLTEIKSATTFYKKSYSNNFSKYVRSLIKQEELAEQAKDVFALPAATRKRLKSKLA